MDEDDVYAFTEQEEAVAFKAIEDVLAFIDAEDIFVLVQALVSPAVPVVLDFSAGIADSRVLFTRAGDTTGAGGPADNNSYFDSAGHAVYARRHNARVEYNPLTLAIRGLVVEPQATNLILQSSNLAQGSWAVVGGTTRTDNNAVSPTGAVDATKITSFNGTIAQGVQQNVAVSAGQTYADSIFVKANGLQWVYLLLFDGASKNVWFDLTNGVVGNIDAGVTGTRIEHIGNGWYRIAAKWVMGGTPGYLSLRFANSNGATTFTGDGVKGVWAWGGEIKQTTDLVDTYIPTPLTAPKAQTRFVENAKFVVTDGTLVYKFDDDTTQNVAVSAGLHTIPTNLNRRWVKQISGPIVQPSRKVCFHGDSIAAGFLSSKPFWAAFIENSYLNHSTPAAYHARGIDAAGFNRVGNGADPNLTNDAAAQVDAHIDLAYQNWLVVFAGTNDIWLSGDSAAVAFGYFDTYIVARLAAGWVADRIIVCTMLPRQATPANEAKRVTYNASIVSNAAVRGYRLARLDLNANIGQDGDQANTTYYNTDQIHPKDAGHAEIATEIETAMFP